MNRMTYQEAKFYLEECGKASGIVPGLERMERILSLLGNPEEKLSVIHIAGTNGKGSTAAYLASIFSEAGCKTGRFASPAVFGTREMFLITEGRPEGMEYPREIRAVGQPGTRSISREEFSSLVSGLKDIAQKMQHEPCGAPTRFELETAMAFLYFQKEKCDMVIMEAGLGGAGDSTNVLKKPLASVLASISYDHRRFLGETIAEIAAQKAGIIKEGCPVFSYEQEEMGEISKNVIAKEAKEKHAPLVFADFSRLREMTEASGVLDSRQGNQEVISAASGCRSNKADCWWNRFIYKETEYQTRLLGEHQLKNAALAIEVAGGLGITKDCIQRGIQKTYWPGRLERIWKSPDVILDGAHNPDAAKVLAKALLKYYPGRKIIFVMGLFADKDYEKIIAHTLPVAKKTFCVTTHTKRALDAESLCREIRKQGGTAKACESISKAVDMAVQEAGSDGVVAAFGSLSFLRDVRDFFEKGEGEKGRIAVGKGLCLEMNRINALWQQPEFQRLLLELEEKERDRKYCRHGREHIFAVARLMWIFCLEKSDAGKMSKELVYAAAFLHDLGRGSTKKEHAEKSAELAGRLLPLCGYSDAETAMVQSAICMHGQVKKTYGTWEEIQREVSEVVKNGSENELLCGLKEEQQRQAVWLSEVLLKADHDSRDCYACAAREGCYWSEKRKVSWIVG